MSAAPTATRSSRAIEPFRQRPTASSGEEAEPTLEDVFIHLMGQARDNALDG